MKNTGNFYKNVFKILLLISQEVTGEIQLAASIAAKTSSTTNALVYAYGHPDFKKYLKQKLFGKGQDAELDDDEKF